MTGRARLLAFLALGGAALWVLVLGVKSFVFAPLRSVDEQIEQLQGKLEAAAKDRASFLADEVHLRALVPRTFGTSPDTASAEVGSTLTGHILRVGLRESDFTRIPIGERRLPGAVEIGWTVQGEGALNRIVDLLYLLEADPRLHRIDGLVLSAGSKGDRVRARFRFMTLLLNPPPPPGDQAPLSPATLDGGDRGLYAGIVRRDLLRPYVPRRETPSSPIPPDAGSPPAEPSVSDPYLNLDDLRVVSLSSWGNGPEVHVRDTRAERLQVLRPGDELGDVRIVAVDYRPMPMADRGGLLSYSRVILRSHEALFAVECGQTLGQKRALTTDELPPSMR
ncbi:MAG: hypothetical protein H7A46_07580 [Verrucomicrobiales bacterium]|nr:hypothetical protein [Verrucomicrobiales bacterium]